MWAVVGVAVVAGWTAVRTGASLANRAQPASIRELSLHQARWMHKRVRVEGVLRGFSDSGRGPYDVLESEEGFRVAVEDVPSEVLARFMGARVLCQGTFGFREGVGILLSVDKIEPAPAAPAP